MVDSMRSLSARVSLRTVLAALFGAMAILAIAAVGLIGQRVLERESHRKAEARLRDLALLASTRLDRSMYERLRDVEIASLMSQLGLATGPGAARVLEELQRTFPHYAWIGITDRQGRVMVATGGLLYGANVSRQDWFREGLERSYVGDVQGATLPAELLPDAGGGPVRLLELAAPLRGAGGASTGVLGALVSWTWAQEAMRSVVEPAAATSAIDGLILDREGRVLLGPEGTLGRPSPCALPAGDAATVICADGEHVVGIARSGGFRDYPGLGWQVVMRQPAAVAFAADEALRRQLTVAGLALAACFVGAGLLLAAPITRPLRQLAAAAEAMRSGHDAPLPRTAWFAELQALTAGLSGLLGDLRRSEADVREVTAESGKREHFLATLLGRMQDAVVAARNGRVVSANPAALALFGAESAPGLIGRPLLELFDAEARPEVDARLAAAASGGAGPLETTIRRLDGRGRTVEAVVAAVAESGDRVVLAILRDITARKAAERQLAHSQRLEAVGQLTGGMAHDFNNLLTVVIGNLDLLQDAVRDQPVARELAELALSASLRGAELTRALLAFARQQTLAPRTVELNGLVVGTTALLKRTLGERIEIRSRLAPDLWPAVADAAQLESALANLAINARDAMPEGGVLRIETANARLDQHYAEQNPEVVPGDYVALAVSDTGGGIPPELLDRVIEPFFTTKQPGKGSGLGLSMVYGFAKQSRGHLKIYSEPGQGTTVRLYLPRAVAAGDAAATAEEPEARAPDDGGAVLVVEDRADVRRMVARHLGALGYHVLEAENGAAAMAILRSEARIDVLFTDVVMPGTTGVDLAHEARTLRPGLKVLLTSGFADFLQEDGNPAPLPGPLLSKPYRRQDLARALRALIEGAG
jgi:PAS domain S-box-containing protein